MIRFFRTIRKKLMEQNKIRTYLLYAVGEIILVVIGILLALQINNWNEARKNQEISSQTINNLRVELEEVKNVLESTSAYNEKSVNQAQSFVNDELTLDSLMLRPGTIFEISNYRPADINLPILQQETSSDRLIIDEIKLNKGQDNLSGLFRIKDSNFG